MISVGVSAAVNCHCLETPRWVARIETVRWFSLSGKVHQRQKEWRAKTYPRCSTEEPTRLPRRGRLGSWMREPFRGVAKLDGTNSAQQSWWSERATQADRSFGLQLQQAQRGEGMDVQDVLDAHLAELDALRVQMPSADDFRLPHIRHLSKTAKPNLVHDLAVSEGRLPQSSNQELPAPAFVGDSLEVRYAARRGRFMGKAKTNPSTAETNGETPQASPSTRESLQFARRGGWHEGEKVPSQSSSGVRLSARSAVEDEGDPEVSPGEARPGHRHLKATGAASAAADSTSSGLEAELPARATPLASLWSSYGASWISVNGCVVPSTFPQESSSKLLVGGTMESYHHTRTFASLFDLSYKVGFRVTGVDREFVADQFLTCSLSSMRVGDVQYACILDSKGLILDDAFVYLTDDSVEVLSSGCHSRQVADYLGQYIVYVRRSGADVSFTTSVGTVVLALQGPRAREALAVALRLLAYDGLRLAPPSDAQMRLSPDIVAAMPFMSYLTLSRPSAAKEQTTPAETVVIEGAAASILCVGTTGEDGFELVASGRDGAALAKRFAEALLRDPTSSAEDWELSGANIGCEATFVRPAGGYCLDMLRMEAGLPRAGVDVPPGTVTPIRASLVWTLDQAKMRSHLMFGWQKLFAQLAKGPAFRRVMLVVDGPAHGGCRLLSNPNRQPIGQITSTCWSPTLGARVAMAYVKPEYARADRSVLITVPYNLPTHKMRKKAIKKWLRHGALRSSYRRLVAAYIAPLPLVPHRYPEPEKQRKALARLKNTVRDGWRPQEMSQQEPAPQGAMLKVGVAAKLKHTGVRSPPPSMGDDLEVL